MQIRCSKTAWKPFGDHIIKEPWSWCNQVTGVNVRNNSSSWMHPSQVKKYIFSTTCYLGSAYIHTDKWHMSVLCINCHLQKKSKSSDSQHFLVCVLVFCWLCDESHVAHTSAELRAFHLFPSLAPDLPPTMGSWPQRLTPVRTPALPDTVAADIYECTDACFARRHTRSVSCVTPSSDTLV